MDVFENAKAFIYKNARPLDLFRFQFLFENGSKENVLNTLKMYQNSDGGFAHGLEPDCWNEQSTPLQTLSATKIISEIGYDDKESELIKGIVQYLCSKSEFSNGYWNGLSGVKSNNMFPHAPWWTYNENAPSSYNPTASLAGFLLKFSDKESKPYCFAADIARNAFIYLKENVPLESIHEISCFIELYDYLKSENINDVIDLALFKEILEIQIDRSITKDVSLWNSEYICKPSQFIKSMSSDFYQGNKEICDYECKFIIEKQNTDGTWNVTWNWTEYMEQWNIAKNWWYSDIIINNLKYIQEFGAVTIPIEQ